VIALAALAIALGGTSYAAIKIPANSVGSKQLKANAVTGSKIKNGVVTGAKVHRDTLTGDNIVESSLGKVPAAAAADTLGGYSAGDLGRQAVSSPDPTADVIVGSGETAALTPISITAPAPGFIRVQMTGNAIGRDGVSTSCPCELQGTIGLDNVIDNNRLVFAVNLLTSNAVAGWDREAVAGSTVYTVDSGQHTITFLLDRTAGTSDQVGVSNASLEATYVPFDGTGAQPVLPRPHKQVIGASNR
jgi:hypothetical protein